MRVLVTGAGGFVGPHAVAAIAERWGAGATIIATARQAGKSGTLPLEGLDVTDASAVRDALRRHRPTHVLHLAGIAAPAHAASNRALAWAVHVGGADNLGRGILAEVPDCVLVHAGTGLVYGDAAKAGRPLDETVPVAPVGDYACTKAAADMVLGALAGQGLRCLRMRPFNHAGPGQSEDFVVSAFAAQVARIEAGQAEPVIRVGNLDASRDFLDVRDVARAYAAVMAEGSDAAPGEILNIASGVATPIQQILDMLVAMSRVELTLERDPARLQPSDLPVVVGDAQRIRTLFGWQPRHELRETLAATLDHWRST